MVKTGFILSKLQRALNSPGMQDILAQDASAFNLKGANLPGIRELSIKLMFYLHACNFIS